MERQITFRKAVSADLGLVKSCALAAYEPYVKPMGRMPAPMIQDFEAVLPNVTVTDPFYGYAVMFEKQDAWFVENLAIHPLHHGKGLGACFMQTAIKHASKNGLGKIELYTNVHMVPAQRFYERLGFLLFDRKSEDGFERLYYRKWLDDQVPF